MRATILIGFAILSLGVAVGQSKGETELQVRQEDGGSVSVKTASGFLNQDSSLKRTWYVIDDPTAPARLDRAGVFPHFDDKEKSQYLIPVGTVSPKEAISAVEVRYALFNVWGDHLRTIAVTRLVDSSTHVDLRQSNQWLALDSEVSQLVSVAAFVARVRTADGDVWSYDTTRMVALIDGLGLNVGTADLVPDEQRMVNPGLIYWTYTPKQGDTSAKTAGVLKP